MTDFPFVDMLEWPTAWRTGTSEGADFVSTLISHALRGEQVAFANLHALYVADIYRLCFSLLQHGQDAEEVTQDTFEYAFRKLAAYRPQKAAFRTWLYQIAISRCRNKRRRKWLPAFSLQAVSDEAVPDASAPDPVEAAALSEEHRAVIVALGELSPKLREVVVLRYYGSLAYAEIGDILGIPAKTVESRMRLAHRALKGLLALSPALDNGVPTESTEAAA